MKLCLAAASALAALAGLGYWLFFAPISAMDTSAYIYIDGDDTPDSVLCKIEATANPRQTAGYRISAALLSYGKGHVREGRYAVAPGIGSLRLVRNLRNGRQAPVRLVIPVVHTMDDLAGRLGQVLKGDSTMWSAAFRDEELLALADVDTATAPCLFLPNTYEVYWDIMPEGLVRRMMRERAAFWTPERRRLAAEAGLSPDEAVTLASIVEQETTDEGERPAVAGMYINRLHQGMKLQADPTVKFALRDFSLRRILNTHLAVESPYNTYRHEGLPPGPICIPSLSAIEAVLRYQKHTYIYMCAKEDFSGTHNFASTYAEHMANARKYADALNDRGIK